MSDGVEQVKGRPPVVWFDTVVVEDAAATMASGVPKTKEVDRVFVKQPGSKETWIGKVDKWFAEQEVMIRQGRVEPSWLEQYKRAYAAWKNNQELPLEGTPIKGWGIIPASQQEDLIRMHIRTVEDLASIDSEVAKRIGLGAMTLRDRAKAWLEQLNDKGPLTIRMAAVEAENRNLQAENASLQSRLQQTAATVGMLEQRLLESAYAIPQREERAGFTPADAMAMEPHADNRSGGKRNRPSGITTS